MSLEAAIAQLTAAVEANTAALGGTATKPAAAKKGAAAAAAAQPAATPAAAAAPANGPDVKACAQALMALAQSKGRDAAVAVLAPFGVPKVTDLKPEQFAAFSMAVAAAQAAPVAQPAAAGSDLI